MKALKFLYTLYVGIFVLIIIGPALISILLTPQKVAQKLSRIWLRLVFLLGGCPIQVVNPEFLSEDHPMIYLSNHISYLDSLLLISVLPAGVVFVGKQELFKSSFIKLIMVKLGHITVERRDIVQGLSDLEVMEKKIKGGESLMIFPEGTFTHIIGLRLFKLGAFKLAVETRTPVCPLSIRGTRQILPDPAYLLRPHKIIVTVSEPLYPQGKDWESVLRLRSLARSEIAKTCGEPVYEED